MLPALIPLERETTRARGSIAAKQEENALKTFSRLSASTLTLLVSLSSWAGPSQAKGLPYDDSSLYTISTEPAGVENHSFVVACKHSSDTDVECRKLSEKMFTSDDLKIIQGRIKPYSKRYSKALAAGAVVGAIATGATVGFVAGVVGSGAASFLSVNGLFKLGLITAETAGALATALPLSLVPLSGAVGSGFGAKKAYEQVRNFLYRNWNGGDLEYILVNADGDSNKKIDLTLLTLLEQILDQYASPADGSEMIRVR